MVMDHICRANVQLRESDVPCYCFGSADRIALLLCRLLPAIKLKEGGRLYEEVQKALKDKGGLKFNREIRAQLSEIELREAKR